MMNKRRHDEILARIEKMVQAGPGTAEWLRIACRHRSWVNEKMAAGGRQQDFATNERLEFLGDSALGLVMARILYERLPRHNEGQLSRAKSRLVSTAMLAAIARKLDLGSAVLLGRGEELTGGRERASLLADTLEAVVGAVFLTAGLSRTEAFISELWKSEIEQELAGSGSEDFKTLLQELVQKSFGTLPVYAVDRLSGPDHKRQYEISVIVQGRVYGCGCGPSKKQAAQNAAAQAYHALGQETSGGETE